MRLLVLFLLGLTVVGVLALPSTPAAANSNTQVVAPLLSCPNVDGSPDNKVLVGDILAVVQAYFNDWPATDYTYLYDLANPYNPSTGGGGQERVDDILAVVQKYFTVCPAVDTQVASATRWVLTQHPELLTEDPGALSALGYIGISAVDVPGQGVHYSKGSLWDGHFDPAEPEGLVYNDGRLAAQLYVVNGYNVGWVPEDPGPNEGPCGDGIDNGGDGFTDGADSDCVLGPPVGPPPDDVNFDPYGYCGAGVACSWAMDEGWHLHYRLCIVHVGTPYAHFVALPSGQGQAECDAVQNAPPNAGAGFDLYFERMGWMGHLWNWLPNGNSVPDVNGSQNGRFADCFPDVTKDTSRGNQLDGAVSANAKTININNPIGTGLPTGAGLAYISDGVNSEQISYTANSGTQLTGVVRGLGATTAGAHASGLNIYKSTSWNAYNCPQ